MDFILVKSSPVIDKWGNWGSERMQVTQPARVTQVGDFRGKIKNFLWITFT